MRSAAQLILAVTVLIGIGLVWMLANRLLTPSTSSSSRTVLQVRQLAKLTTLEVPITDAQTSRLEGQLGGLDLVLLVHGDVLFWCDLEQARFERCDHSERQAVLLLPSPHAARPRVDHERTQVYRIDRSGAWVLVLGSAGEDRLINAAMRRAQHLLLDVASQPRYRDEARRHTVAVLERFFSGLGWSVQIKWSDDGASK